MMDGCWLLRGGDTRFALLSSYLSAWSGSARRSSRRRAGSSALPGWWAASLGEGGMEDRLPRFSPPIKPRGCSLILSGSNSPGGKIGDQSLARAKVPGHCRDLLFFRKPLELGITRVLPCPGDSASISQSCLPRRRKPRRSESPAEDNRISTPTCPHDGGRRREV